jgi:multisubunit Na+/H+ antiporter MnhB subunit
MKERLPIWLQAMALACVSAVLIMFAGWVSANEEFVNRGDLERSSALVLTLMSLCALVLGVRFLWQFRDRWKSQSSVDHLCFYVSAAFAFSAVILLILYLWAFLFPVLRVREAGHLLASIDFMSGIRL